MAVGGIVAKVVHHDLSEPLILSALQYRAIKKCLEHLGHHCQQVYSHAAKLRNNLESHKIKRVER
jgi:hypothetical protein